MEEKINIANKETTIEYLERIRTHDYVPFDIQITNCHIKDINELVGRNIFTKSSLYVSSKTLHDIMQPIGGSDNHNYHGLTPEDVYMTLESIKDPKSVFIVRYGRYAIVSVELSHLDLPLMMIVETHAGLQLNSEANINKIVTIYPKSDIDDYIAKMDKRVLLYTRTQK